MKWLIILGLIFVLGVLIFARYRRQIQTALYLLKIFRKMRQAAKPEEKQIQKQQNSAQQALVKCSKCGTWVPQNSALKLRSNMYYCSTLCMENAVKVV